MSEHRFVAKWRDHTQNLDKSLIPIEAFENLVKELGVMVSLWEDPSDRPDQPPEEAGKLHLLIAIPDFERPDMGQGWLRQMLKAEYEADPKASIQSFWDDALKGFLTEFLNDPTVMAARCSQCREWYRSDTEHVCSEVPEE